MTIKQNFEFIIKLREKIMPQFNNLDVRIPHIEILSKSEIKNNFNKNINFEQLKNIDVDIKNIENYCLIGKAYVLNIGKINEIMRHITIVFGINYCDFDKVKNLTLEVVQLI